MHLAKPGKHADRLAALIRHELFGADHAPQCGGENAASASADHEVDVTKRALKRFLRGLERPGHPGRAEYPSGSQHKRPARSGARTRALLRAWATGRA